MQKMNQKKYFYFIYLYTKKRTLLFVFYCRNELRILLMHKYSKLRALKIPYGIVFEQGSHKAISILSHYIRSLQPTPIWIS